MHFAVKLLSIPFWLWVALSAFFDLRYALCLIRRRRQPAQPVEIQLANRVVTEDVPRFDQPSPPPEKIIGELELRIMLPQVGLVYDILFTLGETAGRRIFLWRPLQPVEDYVVYVNLSEWVGERQLEIERTIKENADAGILL